MPPDCSRENIRENTKRPQKVQSGWNVTSTSKGKASNLSGTF
jgi:hypothetical protein